MLYTVKALLTNVNLGMIIITLHKLKKKNYVHTNDLKDFSFSFLSSIVLTIPLPKILKPSNSESIWGFKMISLFFPWYGFLAWVAEL